jgi:hypothetical protein
MSMAMHPRAKRLALASDGHQAICDLAGGLTNEKDIGGHMKLEKDKMKPGVAIAVAMGIGIAIGNSIHQLAIGVALGVAFGVALAAVTARKQQAKG